MIGIVKYYYNENRKIPRGIIVVVPLDGSKTVRKLEIGKANLKRGENVFEGDIVTFELESNDNTRQVNNVTKAVHCEGFFDILQDGSFQDNYIHIKNFIFNYDSYAYQNFKKAVSSLVSDEMAEKEVVVWPELNPQKIETFIPKRYAGSNNHLGTFDSDKKLFEGVNAKKWFRIRYIPYIPKGILRDNRDMWENLDEKTVISLLIQRIQTTSKIDDIDLKLIRNFLPENKLETIVRGHIQSQSILWDLDRLFLLNHRELFEQIPIEVIEKTPQMWNDLSVGQAQDLVRYHLNNNLTKHWEWDKGWILQYPELLDIKREYLSLIDEEFLNRIDKEDLTIKYWQLCYEYGVNKEKANKEIIKQEIKKRGIRHLYHFTRASNLESILNYGLLPRTTLENRTINYEYNDPERYDKCKNAVCTSIEFPNYKMFFPLRQNLCADWVVLELDAKILYELECAFCWMNASDSRISNIGIEERKTCTTFKELFDNRVGFPQRDSRLNDSDPTNPQAEVLVFSNIPVDYIKKIYFRDREAALRYISNSNILPNMNEQEMVWIWDAVFKYRVDYKNWQ